MELTMERVRAQSEVAFAGVREVGYQELLARVIQKGAVLPVWSWGWFPDTNMKIRAPR